MERQRVFEKEAETQKKIAISEAEKHAQVSKIQMEQKLTEKDSLRRQEEISNTMYLAREKSLADADFYRYISSLFTVEVVYAFWERETLREMNSNYGYLCSTCSEQ